MLPATRPSGQQQVEGDDEKPTVGNNEDAVEEYKEAFYVISEEDAHKREHLEKLLNLFTTADPILPELYRNTKVYRVSCSLFSSICLGIHHKLWFNTLS